MRSLFALLLLALLLLACPSMLSAQSASTEPPMAGRPAQFSNVVGSYEIAARAEPTNVAVEEPITLRVTISGRGPAKYQPSRKHLRLFPESWAKDFYVEPAPEEDRFAPELGKWEFVYRLRPRHTGATVIDGIKLIYYQPPAGKTAGRFQTARVLDSIPISVKPRPTAPVLPDHLSARTAPPSFYEWPEAAAAPARQAAAPVWPVWLFATLLLGPPLLTVCGVVVWRRRQHAQPPREQSRAARLALQALQQPGGEPAWVVFGRYLRDRLDFPAEEATPAEVRRFLRRRGTSRPIGEKLAAFLGSCDAARFAGPGRDGTGALREQAGQLILALEEDLCAP
jgi:hypothetical protein